MGLPKMSGSADWQETAYRDTFEKEITGIRRRLALDPGCTVADLEGTLKGLYTIDGQDWLGRGEVQSINLAAAIAAYEAVIEELKKI